MQSPTDLHALPDSVRLCASIQHSIEKHSNPQQEHHDFNLESFRREVQGLLHFLRIFEKIQTLNEPQLDLEVSHLREVGRLLRRCHGTLLNLHKTLGGRHQEISVTEPEPTWTFTSQQFAVVRFYISFYKRTLEMSLMTVNLIRRWKAREPPDIINNSRKVLADAIGQLRLSVLQRRNLTGGSHHEESVEEMGLLRDIDQCILSAEKLQDLDRLGRQEALRSPVRTFINHQVRNSTDLPAGWLAEIPIRNGSLKSSSASDNRTLDYISDDSEVESIEYEPTHDAGFSAEVYNAMITALLRELREKMDARNHHDAGELCKTIMKHSRDRQAKLGILFEHQAEVDLALAEICLDEKRYQRAKKIVSNLLQGNSTDPDYTFRLHLLLAKAYAGRRQYSKGETYARSSLRGREGQYGRDHPATVESAMALIEIYELQGDTMTASVLSNIYRSPTVPSPPPKSALRGAARPTAPNMPSSPQEQPVTPRRSPETNQSPTAAQSPSRIRWAPDVWVNESSINAPMNELGQTPLVYAIHQEDEAYVKLNIERGANVNKPCADGIAPLMHAVTLGYEQIVETLLKAGAQVDNCTSGWTSLHQAIELRQLGITRLLIAFGADIEAQSPFEYVKPKSGVATLRRQPDRGADADSMKSPRWTPLLRAAFQGNQSIVGLLLDHQANIEARSPIKATPLMYACRNLHFETVDLLSIRGANIHITDEYGWQPLHHTVVNLASRSKEALRIVALLLSHEADINAKCTFGKTPLHYAVEKGNAEVVSFLIASRADIEARDFAELTPLHTAIKCRLVGMVGLLLEHGADSGAMDLAGDDALAAAKHADKKSPEIMEMLSKDRKIKKEKSNAVAGRGHGRKGSFATIRSRRGSTQEILTENGPLLESKKKRWFGGKSK